MVFAVVTIKSVLLYDTQHGAPFAKVSGRHLAPINDASWSADGHSLAICSSDGYVSFIKLAPSTIGMGIVFIL